MLDLLKKYNLEPKHFRGQNFLINENVLAKIVKAADLKETDQILEVGPGLGVLTKELVASGGNVLAVELDKALIYVLNQEVKKPISREIKQGQLKLEIWNDDILKVRSGQLQEFFKDKDYKIVANIPYNITAHFLRKFLETDYPPTKMVLLVQKEVAQRIVAKPGKMSLLSVSVQYFSEPKIIEVVSRDSFYPAPKVESAIIDLKIKKIKKFDKVEIKNFFRIVKIGFSSKRKQLQNNLANGLPFSREEFKEMLVKIGLNDNVRAQELSLDDWYNLVNILK